MMFRCLATTLLALPLAAAAQNLLTQNPGFESGGPYHGWSQAMDQTYSFSGWTAYKHQWSFNRSQGVLNGDGAQGTRCFDADSAGYVRTATAARPAVTPGRVYEVRYHAKKTQVRSSSWAGVVPRLVFFDAAGNELKNAYGPEAVGENVTTGWREFAFRATAPAGAAKAGVQFDFEYQVTDPNTDANPAAGHRLDHVRLTEVPQTDGVALRRAPMFVAPGGTNTVVLRHRAPAPRDLLLRLLREGQPVGEVRTAVAAGRGVVTNLLVTPADAPRSDAYAWEARLVEPGGAWESFTAAKAVPGVFLDQTPVVAASFPANHTNLVLEGRWTPPSAGSSRRQAVWQGSSLHARFEGTSFRMRYDYTSFDAAHRLRLWVVVDGGEPRAVNLNQGADAVGTLASGLSGGVHTITVMREGEEVQGVWGLRSVQLDAGRGLLRHAPFMDRRLEFYGDSTFSGGDGGMWVNVNKTTARALGAASSVVSKGATGVSGGFVFNYNALWYWDRATFDVFYNASGPQPYAMTPAPDAGQGRGLPWGPGNFNAYGDVTTTDELPEKGGFGRWPADAVVIGYGQNDQFGAGPWVANYRQFVILLRKVYPRAHIICTHTSMTGDANWFQAAIEPILADRGPGGVNADGKVHMLLLRPSGLGAHPPPQDHHDMAHGNRNWRGLVDFVEDVVGWGLDAPAGTPAEVRGAQTTPGGMRFEIEGGEDCAYVVEGSTNLVDWLPALTNRSHFQVTLEPTAEPQRFFRAVYAGRGAEFAYSPPVPLAPAGLRLMAVSSNSAALAWTDRSANEHGFTVERRQGGGAFAPVATLPANTTGFTDTGLAALTTYGYRVRAFNAAGPSAWSAELRAETDAAVLRAPDAPADVVPGLRYRYFEGSWDKLPNFAALTAKAAGTVANFSLAPRLRNDEFAFEFTGFLEAPADGTYTLSTASDDGSQLFIGATRVVDNDGLHGVETRSGRIALRAGRHALRVTMFEKGGGEALEVRWSGPGIADQPIPAGRLFRTP